MTDTAATRPLRAADGDVWYRAITNKRHFPGGRVHHSALKKYIDVPENLHAAWKAEISGRLRSMGNDIAEDGERRVRRQVQLANDRDQSGKEFGFVAVLYAYGHEVRGWPFIAADVIFEEKGYDHAHANIVFLQNPPIEVQALNVLDDIIGALHVVASTELASIPEPSGGPPS